MQSVIWPSLSPCTIINPILITYMFAKPSTWWCCHEVIQTLKCSYKLMVKSCHWQKRHPIDSMLVFAPCSSHSDMMWPSHTCIRYDGWGVPWLWQTSVAVTDQQDQSTLTHIHHNLFANRKLDWDFVWKYQLNCQYKIMLGFIAFCLKEVTLKC